MIENKITNILINKINFIFLNLTLVILFIQINPSFGKEKLNLNYNNVEVLLEGNFIQGGLVKGKTNPKIEIKFKDKLLRKNLDGYFVIGFGRDHPDVAYLSLKPKWYGLKNRLQSKKEFIRHKL